MREDPNRTDQNSRTTGVGDLKTEANSRGIDHEHAEPDRSIFLAVVSIVLLSTALVIAGLMILQLRQDRDELKLDDKRHSTRISTLEGQIKSMGGIPIPETTVNSPPITIVLPNGAVVERSTTTSTSTTTTTRPTTSSTTAAPVSTTTTTAQPTTTTTTQPETCVGPVCIKEFKP